MQMTLAPSLNSALFFAHVPLLTAGWNLLPARRSVAQFTDTDTLLKLTQQIYHQMTQ